MQQKCVYFVLVILANKSFRISCDLKNVQLKRKNLVKPRQVNNRIKRAVDLIINERQQGIDAYLK